MIYQDIVVVAGFIFIYSLFAKRIEKTALSGPMLAVIVGVIFGPLLLNVFNAKLSHEGYRTLAELALALVLFTDAANTNLRVLRKNIAIPTRLLVIGLPLTIVFGVAAALMIFNGFSWLEVGILAAMLAPTDAALGKAVVTNPAVPTRIREALNVESGLNDGISVPVLFLLIALFSDDPVSNVDFKFGLGLFAEAIGIGVIVGLAVAFGGNWLTHFATKRQWISESWKPIVIVTLALGCFALAQLLGGSGFIACFVGGLLYGFINPHHKLELLESAEGTGDMLSLLTWGIFGAFVVPAFLPDITWQIVVYSLLSLTFVRMLPVFLSLIRTDFSIKEKLFIGWFGPRGLASIVFAIIVLDVPLPHKPTIILTVVCTVLLSIVLHGVSAISLIKGLEKSEK